jgi:NAD(P)-dependent dehydrogenase (short-subunit alcohol dehydrogenase family)
LNWLQNKKIVIIGGTSGMGLSAAKAFLAHGASLVILGKGEEDCQKAQAILGNDVIVIEGDACQEGVAKSTIDLCLLNFGGFDGLYHLAGGSGRKFGDGPLHEITLDGWNKTFELNLTSLFLANQAAVQQFLLQNKGGTILNMGSVLGYSPSPKYFTTHAYAATKSALIGFVKATAAHYATNNIRINILAPALVETPMSQRALSDQNIMNFVATKQPLDGGRHGQPQDLDGAAVYFMSDYSAFTTGQILSVDGGWSVTEGQYA